MELLLRCGADPLHTCFDEVAFKQSQDAAKKGAEEEKKPEKKEPENPFSFEPPAFVFVKLEPDEDTAAILAKRNKVTTVIVWLLVTLIFLFLFFFFSFCFFFFSSMMVFAIWS